MILSASNITETIAKPLHVVLVSTSAALDKLMPPIATTGTDDESITAYNPLIPITEESLVFELKIAPAKYI